MVRIRSASGCGRNASNVEIVFDGEWDAIECWARFLSVDFLKASCFADNFRSWSQINPNIREGYLIGFYPIVYAVDKLYWA
jgi:hypothetical protein